MPERKDSLLVKRIIEHLRENPQGCDSKEISIVCEIDKSRASWTLSNAFKAGKIDRSDHKPFIYRAKEPLFEPAAPLLLRSSHVVSAPFYPSGETRDQKVEEKVTATIKTVFKKESDHLGLLGGLAVDLARRLEKIDEQAKGRAPTVFQIALDLVFDGEINISIGRRRS